MSGSGNGPRRIGGTLRRRDSDLADLYSQAQRLLQFEEMMLAALPAQARGHVRLARIDERELVVMADRPEWRHQLRYLAPRLQATMETQTGIRPQRVLVKIGDLPRRPAPQPPRHLSTDAGRTIGSTAASVDDPALAAALARLASRATDNGDER